MNFVAEHRQLLDAARDLAASPRVVEAMGEVARDEMVWADANQDTDAFLSARAIDLAADSPPATRSADVAAQPLSAARNRSSDTRQKSCCSPSMSVTGIFSQ